jgi:glycosyltransferase involved in cell wall biosynthesis
MKPLRIAHVTATFPPYRGGTGNVCYHNARELTERGHEVHVFTAAMPGAPAGIVHDGITVHRMTPLARIGNAPVLPGLVAALRGFDLVHLHYPFILGAEQVRLAALLHRMPVVISFHNDLIGNGARALVFDRYQRLSAVLTVRSAAQLCAVSLDHYQSSRLWRALPGACPPATELPNGVDCAHFAPGDVGEVRARYGIPTDVPLVLFIAALDRAHHFKRLDVLIRALATMPDLRLLIVGDGDMRTAYEQEVAAAKLTDRTIFVGAVDHQQTPPFFRAADVTVLPSSPPESFGLVLIESLACGTPVIASNIPGVRTVVAHGSDGLLVPAGNPGALASTLGWFLARPNEQRRAMGMAGRDKVERNYTWPVIGARLERVYAQILTPRA